MRPGISSASQRRNSQLVRRNYQKVNAYSHRASIEQVLTMALFIIQFALHCIFLIRPILAIHHIILYFMWAISYILLLMMILDYCLITCGDPVDRMITDEAFNSHFRRQRENFMRQKDPEGAEGVRRSQKGNPYATQFCEDCGITVQYSSYHCWRCMRCVEGMDHHCKYLNNCIGQRNYGPFFRMLVATTIYLLIGVGQGIWVFYKASKEQRIDSLAFSRWAVLAYMILEVALILAVDSLLFFHCYISCCRRMTTVEYLFRQTSSNFNNDEEEKKNDNLDSFDSMAQGQI